MQIKVPGPCVPKPRMTRQDKWKQRAPVLRYREYADRIREACSKAGLRKQDRVRLSCVFRIAGYPHMDLSNLMKAVEDAMLGWFLTDDDVKHLPEYGVVKAVLQCETCSLRKVGRAGAKKGVYLSDCGEVAKCPFMETSIRIEALGATGFALA